MLRFLIVVTFLNYYTDGIIRNTRCAFMHENTTSKIGILFYGLSRGLHYTINSFERHLFAVLERDRIAYDVFWSTVVTHGTHLRQNDPNDYQLMRPCVFSTIDQNFIRHKEFEKYCQARNNSEIIQKHKRCDHRTKENFEVVKNMLTAFYTQNLGAEMILEYIYDNRVEYDALLVVRPDTALISDIDIGKYMNDIKNKSTTTLARVIIPDKNWRNQIRAMWNLNPNNGPSQLPFEDTIYVPDFHHFTGCNDRLAFGSPHVILQYLRRGNVFRDYPNSPVVLNSGSSEELAACYLKSLNVSILASSVRLIRITATGGLHSDDIHEEVYCMNANKADIDRCIFPNHTLNWVDC